MTAFSELIIFLSLALLAVVVAIFVFAASLLRNAIPQALEKQRKIAGEQSEKFESAIAEMQVTLEAARGTGGFGEVEKKLHDYGKSRKQFEKASKRITGRYQLLKMKGGVVYPAVVLLLALALARSVELVTEQAWQGILFGLSLLAVVWVGYRIYEILSVVQSVAMTPEDVGDKTREAFEVAMERYEERKRPVLNLKFIEPEPPFKFEPSSQQVIRFDISLQQGDVARSVIIDFIVPEGFDFPEHESHRRATHASLCPGALSTRFEVDSVKRDMIYYKILNIKAPSTPGTYTLHYWLGGEGCITRFVPFEVEIAE